MEIRGVRVRHMSDLHKGSIEGPQTERVRSERDLVGHTSFVTACAMTPDGRVVSASEDKTLKVWDLASGQLVATLQGHADKVLACAVTPDGRRVVSASEDKTLKVWDLASEQLVATLQGHADRVLACAVTSDGRAVSASEDKTLKVWDLASEQLVATLQGHADRVLACAVTPDGRAVSASEDKTLKVWDLASGQLIATLQGHRLGVTACAVTPDGWSVISASYDNMFTVWDLVSGRPVASWPGHDAFVLACAVTPDGRHVVSASDDRTLKVWDLASKQLVATLHGHASFVTACAVTPDGRRVVSASWDKTLKVWDLPRVAPQPSRRGESTAVPPTVDIGIVTIRDDEFRAVLGAFPSKAGIFKGARTRREYSLHHADAGDDAKYTVAVLRQIEQGNGEAQSAARDLIEDFAPRLILVVGIAAGIPSDDVKLGDVILSMRIHDFTVEARKVDEDPTYSTHGGPVPKALASAIANLPAQEHQLGDWAAALPPQPPLLWTREDQIYGPPEWQRKLRTKLERHYGAGSTPRAPKYVDGPIASSDRLVKDPAVLIPWLQTAHTLLAVEMESGGIYRAAQERCPMLAIRGISDFVGLERSDDWTKYACASAAAFTRAFLRTQPVSVGASPG